MAKPVNAVVDLSHHNENVDFRRAQTDGIVGVIYKATQGVKYKDRTYQRRRTEALDAGLLWGAYHFGVGGSGVDQADHFLEATESDDRTLLVLDYEPNVSGPTMTLAEARKFVERVAQVTGRFPGLYSGHLIKERLGKRTTTDPLLANCFLWLAQYSGPGPRDIPKTFKTWTLWQYTDGVHGPNPHHVDGIGQCDRNMFNGSLAQLEKLWGVGQGKPRPK